MNSENTSSSNSICSHLRSSTSSLVSILDDELSSNFDISVTISEDEPENFSENVELSDSDISSLSSLSELIADANNLEVNENNNHEADKLDCNKKDEKNIDNLTPWGKWVLTKAMNNKKIISKKQKEIASNIQKEEQAKQLKEDRQKKFEELFASKVKKWNRDLAMSSLKKSSSEKLIPNVPKEKLDENFRKWTERKFKNLKELRNLKKAEMLGKLMSDQDKQRRAKESYDAWLEKNKGKNVGQRRSHTYINVRLSGYYDSEAYPRPAYINPNPWKS